MKVRGIIVMLCLFSLLFYCKKQTANVPPINSTQPKPPAELPYEKPAHLAELDKELRVLGTNIVQKLIIIDNKATEFQKAGDPLAVRQVYEEAYDIITEYEDDENNVQSQEYITIKDKILKNWGEILQKEGFEINVTSTDIQQQETTILQEILNAERENDTVPVATPPANSTMAPIPQIINTRVSKWIERFKSGDQHKYFEVWIERSGTYLPMIFEILRKEGLPDEIAYLAMIESGFNPAVSSSARAVGMWQFISATGKNNGLKIDNYIDERRDPVKSTRAAVKHLKDLYYYWNEDWFLALSAYNVSEKRLKSAIKQYKTNDFWQLKWPLPLQTREYIPKFLAAVEIMKDPAKYGFKPPEMKPPKTYEEVKISRQASLDVIAQAAGVSEKAVKELNNELWRSLTPPSGKQGYVLRLPEGTKERFSANFAKVPDKNLITSLRHTVRSRETISEIAEMYRVSQNHIMVVNNIRDPKKLQIGQVLTIHQPSSGFNLSAIEQNIASRNTPVIPKDANNRTKIAYTVRKNDNPGSIADAHGVGVNSLLAWNGLSSKSYIFPNQKLTIWLPKNAQAPAQQQSNPPTKEQTTTSVQRQTTSTTRQAANTTTVVYTIRYKDTISGISNFFGIPVRNILEWNGLTSRSTIYPGDKIYLYLDDQFKTNTSIQSEGETIIYTVKSGDNLWDIARYFGTTVPEIVRINKWNSMVIHPGDKLIIPASQPKGKMP